LESASRREACPFDGKRVTGVEVVRDGKLEQFRAGCEVVLSLGAIQTPKILMQSGIGDSGQLRSFGIGVIQHLPGVGANLQEHVLLAGCVWEYARPDQSRGACGDATFLAKSDPALATPDLQAFVANGPFLSAELSGQAPAGPAWSITPGLVRPQSRGQVRLTGAKHTDPVDIDLNILSQGADLRATMECVRLCREVGNGAAFRSLTKREACPGPVGDVELEAFVRNAAVPFWHYGQDGPGRPVGRGWQSSRLWHRRPARCGRLDHAECDYRQHHGALRDHRRALRRDTEG